VGSGTGGWGHVIVFCVTRDEREKLVERDMDDNSCGAGKERAPFQGLDINWILCRATSL
jgi:hypothetical protein